MRIGDILLETVTTRSEGDGEQQFVAVRLELPYFPSVTSEGRVVVPDRDRLRLEQVIEIVANLRSVAERMPCRISSLGPKCIFFEPKSDVARQWLWAHEDSHEPEGRSRSLDNWSPIDILSLGEQMLDRMEGVLRRVATSSLRIRGARPFYSEET